MIPLCGSVQKHIFYRVLLSIQKAILRIDQNTTTEVWNIIFPCNKKSGDGRTLHQNQFRTVAKSVIFRFSDSITLFRTWDLRQTQLHIFLMITLEKSSKATELGWIITSFRWNRTETTTWINIDICELTYCQFVRTIVICILSRLDWDLNRTDLHLGNSGGLQGVT